MSVNETATPAVSDYPHGRVPRAVRERQIVDLAEQLFAEHGFQRTSMDELARRAGVSKPVVYDIVGSKEALFHRCFERAGDDLARAMAEAAGEHADDLAGQLRATAIAFLHFVRHHERAWAVLYALDAAGRTDAHVKEIRARQARFVTAMLIELGASVEPARLDAVSYMLGGAFEALAHWRGTHAAASDAAAAEWLVDFALPGLERTILKS
jgi:AcrR family transcriptional regulator